ncbi:integrase catalytic subunit, partial [mine drainage metagenome]
MNQEGFQKMAGSRQERYLKEEKPVLGSLILGSYEYASWQPVKVGSNYHFSLLGVYYSVPYHLRGTEIIARVSGDLVSAYSDNHHVATHQRSFDVGSHITDTSHMPEAHLSYLRDTTKEITSRAQGIGVSCEAVIASVLASHRFPRLHTSKL